MTPTAQRWAEQARYDLETAKAMLSTDRFMYVPFCCQQAIEKMIKGVIAKQTAAMPARTHNLVQLAESAGLKLDVEQSLLMRQLSEYYIQSRYPEEGEPPSSDDWRQIARGILERTDKVVEWLSSMI